MPTNAKALQQQQLLDLAVRLAPTVLEILRDQDAHYERRTGEQAERTLIADVGTTACRLARMMWDEIYG